MSESYFVVEVNNEILGNSIRICNLRSLKGFNLVAYELAKRANKDGKKHTAGMWTVYPYKCGAEIEYPTSTEVANTTARCECDFCNATRRARGRVGLGLKTKGD